MQEPQLALIRNSFKSAVGVMATQRAVFLPYLVIAGIEILTVLGLFVIVQDPWISYLQPIILRYRGTQFLHYPLNLLLVGQVFERARMVLTILAGTFANGLVIYVSWQALTGKHLDLRQAMIRTVRRYVALLIIGGAVVFAVQGFFWAEQQLSRGIMAGQFASQGVDPELWRAVFALVGVVGVAAVQMLFALSQPVLMIETANLPVALARNVRYALRNIPALAILVFVPVVLYTPVALLKGNMAELMKSTAPEIVFFILGGGIVVAFFINVFVTVATTALYVRIKAHEGN